MSVAFILDFDGGTAAQYDAVVEEMDLGGRPAPGCSWHGAGPTATGWRVVDVWDDAATFESFARERMGPVAARHGLGAPRIETVDVAQVRLGGEPGEPQTFLQIVRLDGLDAGAFRGMDARILPEGVAPPHCVYHVNGPTPTGWIVIDSWASRADRDAFIGERVLPAMQAAGISGPPAIEDLELHALMVAAPAHA